MSLAIDIDQISEVLLADGWHSVTYNGDSISSFDIDAYEYLQRTGDEWAPTIYYNGGPGFCFREPELGTHIAGPVSAILAVRYKR